MIGNVTNAFGYIKITIRLKWGSTVYIQKKAQKERIQNLDNTSIWKTIYMKTQPLQNLNKHLITDGPISL